MVCVLCGLLRFDDLFRLDCCLTFDGFCVLPELLFESQWINCFVSRNC